MFTPIKSKGHDDKDTVNDTVLNTPQPQATSTVQRKNRMESRFSDERHSNKEKYKQDLFEGEIPDKEDNSSLGILDNMSVLTSVTAADDDPRLDQPNTDAELECARKLLQRCSNIGSIDTNKDNNINVQNIPDDWPVSNLSLPELDQERNVNLTNKTDIIFNLNEITGRSSGISNCDEQHPPINKPGSFNFSTREVMAQLNNDVVMAQLQNEEFLSASKMTEKLLLDEACWANCTYSMPVLSTEKQKLDLTAFSGIVGQQDLSLESCAGRVSVGKYFQRKSDNIGIFGSDERIKPRFSFNTETPVRTGKPRPLLESTVASDGNNTVLNNIKGKFLPEYTKENIAAAELTMEPKEEIPNVTTDIDKSSIISLSTIVTTLQDANETPRRLVDQLLMAQKMKKNSAVKDDTRETYTLSSDRNSRLTRPTEPYNKFDEDINLEKFSTKLSLDSRTKNDTTDMKQEASRTLSLTSNKNMKEAESSFTSTCKEKVLKIESSDQNMISSLIQETGISISDYKLQHTESSTNKYPMCYMSHKMNRKSYDEESYSNLNIKKEETVKEKDISSNTIDLSLAINTNTEMQFNFKNDVVIGMNTEQFRNCIVGMPSEVNVELVNKGDRWITYYLKLIEIRGDAQSIKLNISKEVFLIKPNGIHSTKIGIKVIKMCKPIFVEFSIILSDMVSKLEWCLKHIIFIKPEELNVICDSYKQELDFQYITENCTKVLPITFHSKNDVDIPVKLFISHDGPKIFSIDSISDGSIKLNESHDEFTNLVLKPHVKIIVNIKCELISTLIDSSQRQPQYWKSNLIMNVQCSDGTLLLQKEVPLYAQTGPGSYDRNSPVSTISSVAVTGNTIPIRATHTALSWNSVKIGRSDVKEFTICNTSDNKIKIQIDICDDSKNFKFVGDRQIANTSIVLAMQRKESKTLAIMFSPYKVGPAVGKIIIKHYTREDSDCQQNKKVPLYGYGGCGKLKIHDTFNDPSGKMWLKLGTLCTETTILSANFALQNVGDICSFAKIKIIPKGISPVIMSSLNVTPKEFILNPKETRHVSVEYQPKKEDLMILQRSAVSHVATINITYGDELTRWRIRRLYEKMEKTHGFTKNENETFKTIVQPICEVFPEEQFISDLTRIRDSVQHLSGLCAGVEQCDITLTVEACADDSLPVHYDMNDESEMYYSLVSDTTQIDEAGGASFFTSQATVEYEARHAEVPEQFTVTPSIIVLNPPVWNEATVNIHSSFKTPQPFQTSLSHSDYFRVTPAVGILPSKQSFPLKIQCLQRIQHNIQAILEIYTENNKQVVVINVVVKRQ